MRLRVAAAVALVGAGAVLASGGPEAVVATGRRLGAHIDVLLIVLGIAALVAALVPRGAGAGWVFVLGAGLLLYGWRHAWFSERVLWTGAGAAVIAAGAWLVSRERSQTAGVLEQLWRRTVVLFPGRLHVPPGVPMPAVLSVVAAGTRLDVDVTAAVPGDNKRTELFVTCWAGRVDLRLPDHWAVVAGRLHTAYGVHMEGRLDSPEPMPHVVTADDRGELDRIRHERADRFVTASAKPEAHVVILHVTGLSGQIRLLGRP